MNDPKPASTLLYLDRYEGEYAVLIDPLTSQSIDIPKHLLPDNTPECTYVSIVITQDIHATQSATKEAAQIIRELTGENK